MANISINLGANIDQKDIDNLRNSLKSLGAGDKITIRIEAADAHEAGKLTDELVRQGFDYQPHGGHTSEFYFTAQRRVE
ncbi:MAG: hypothetical protein N3B21_00665 [Clostridia bacterium]|nr:hypothetical protein [Clostridia bacterium]